MTRRDGSEGGGGGAVILLIENSSALAILIGRVENLWPPIDCRTDPRSDSRAFHRRLPFAFCFFALYRIYIGKPVVRFDGRHQA